MANKISKKIPVYLVKHVRADEKTLKPYARYSCYIDTPFSEGPFVSKSRNDALERLFAVLYVRSKAFLREHKERRLTIGYLREYYREVDESLTIEEALKYSEDIISFLGKGKPLTKMVRNGQISKLFNIEKLNFTD